MDVSALHNEENLAIFNHRDTDAELLKFIQEGLSLHTMIRDETDKKEKKKSEMNTRVTDPSNNEGRGSGGHLGPQWSPEATPS